ncbi:MAG: PDZ domain-containing protein [Luteitalea sp.]|nr:PDZ domain-containing protein [Luteitalea sp.]
MEQKRFLGVATATVAGAGLALALVAPIGHGQERSEESKAPTTVQEKVEHADPAGQAAEGETEDLGPHDAVVPAADGPKALTVLGFESEGGGSWLGVSIRDVTAEDVSAQKLPAAGGAVVTDVDEDSPAAKSGLAEGDVIVTFDEERVRGVGQLSRLVRETPPGRRVAVEVMRDGQQQTLRITPERGSHAWRWKGHQFHDFAESVRKNAEYLRREIEPKVRAMRVHPEGFDFIAPGFPWSGARLGVSVQSLTPQLAEHFRVKSGVLISSVDADSAAAKAGLKAGDVVTAVDGESVDDDAALRRALQDPDKRERALSVTRDRQSISVKVTLPEPASRTRHERV